MGEFIKDRLPDPIAYFESEGVSLVGRGTWRTGPCSFHGGSDSLRVNTKTGAWTCMACSTKGGDVLAHHMQAHGLGFVEAATALGAYFDDGARYTGKTAPSTLPARDALAVIAAELLVSFIVIADVRAGVIPSDDDWHRFVVGSGRVEALAREFAS